MWEVKLPCRTRPHWLEPVLYVCESAADKASPSEGLSVEPQSMLSLALKISSQSAERNVKVSVFLTVFYLFICININTDFYFVLSMSSLVSVNLISKTGFQEFLLAVGVRAATFQHRVVPSSLGWYDQVMAPLYSIQHQHSPSYTFKIVYTSPPLLCGIMIKY